MRGCGACEGCRGLGVRKGGPGVVSEGTARGLWSKEVSCGTWGAVRGECGAGGLYRTWDYGEGLGRVRLLAGKLFGCLWGWGDGGM